MTPDYLRAILQGVRDRLPPEPTDEQFAEASSALAGALLQAADEDHLIAVAEELVALLKGAA